MYSDSGEKNRYLPGGRDYEDPEGNVRSMADLPPDAQWETYPVPNRSISYGTAARGLSGAIRHGRFNSRRGGRSYSEPSDSDLDPWWNGQ